MITKIINHYLNKSKIIQDISKKAEFVQEYANSLQCGHEEIEDIVENLDKRIQALEERVDNKDKRNSSKPWADIQVSEVADNGQVKVMMDWNSAFIDLLKKAGYTGSEEEMVQKYLVAISSQYFDRDIREDLT